MVVASLCEQCFEHAVCPQTTAAEGPVFFSFVKLSLVHICVKVCSFIQLPLERTAHLSPAVVDRGLSRHCLTCERDVQTTSMQHHQETECSIRPLKLALKTWSSIRHVSSSVWCSPEAQSNGIDETGIITMNNNHNNHNENDKNDNKHDDMKIE